MTPTTLDIPVFDADNHLYETREALTQYLPDRGNLAPLMNVEEKVLR